MDGFILWFVCRLIWYISFMCEQALALDDGGLYKERLEVLLHRLELRAQLYKQPEKAEDIAAMIIEQVCGGHHIRGRAANWKW